MATGNFLDRIFQSGLGRIFIAALQTALTSQLLLLTILVGSHVNILLLKYTIVLAVGLMAGFSSRRFLKGHTRSLILLSGFLSAILSLAALHFTSRGFLGINFLDRVSQSPDWQGLIQLTLAALGTWLAGTAFRKSGGMIEEADTPSPLSTSRPALSWLPAIKLPERKRSEPARIVTEKGPSPTSAPRKKRGQTATLKPLPVKKPVRRNKKASKPEIKFVGTETYTCPYCLDEVKEHDPRGVKICQICKTRHHADCWGITGACQIPHSQQKK